jgi:hypothetical protein
VQHQQHLPFLAWQQPLGHLQQWQGKADDEQQSGQWSVVCGPCSARTALHVVRVCLPAAAAAATVAATQKALLLVNA